MKQTLPTNPFSRPRGYLPACLSGDSRGCSRGDFFARLQGFSPGGSCARLAVLAVSAGLGLGGLEPQAADAQVSSIVWHDVGDPGNAPWTDDRYENLKFFGRGQVNHRYRMSETELTVSQWIEFARAYGPFADNPLSDDITGSYINAGYIDDELQYKIKTGTAQYPTDVNWRMAARFANWMHNDQVNEAWAFESGAYDTSTFGINDDYPPLYSDQTTRSPGAKYWIPSMDEWMKAVYYDPNKNGDGQGGWWEQPNGSDTPLIVGLPSEGGQTNSSLALVYGRKGDHLNAGQYPDVRTPWGLLDASGGQAEWTEEWRDWVQTDRHIRGSDFDDYANEGFIWDWIGEEHRTDDPAFTGLTGFRIAMVPAVPTLMPIGTLFLIITRRSRI